jgi:ABC-2 type transport system permease protein
VTAEAPARTHLWAVQTAAFARRELADFIRQPRLLGLLVLGPFAILFLFGSGYRNDTVELKAAFVAPASGPLRDALDRHGAQLSRFVRIEAIRESLEEAELLLDDDTVDLVVVLPADPREQLLSGERVPIMVLNDTIDPLQGVAIQFAVRIAVDELNAAALAAVLGEAIDVLGPAREQLAVAADQADKLRSASEAGDDEARDRSAADLGDTVGDLRDSLVIPAAILANLETEEAQAAEGSVTALRDRLDEVAAGLEDVPGVSASSEVSRRQVEETLEALAEVDRQVPLTNDLRPDVLAQPFRADNRTTLQEPVKIIDYYSAAAIPLLIQHLGMTLGSLSFVRDRALGLFELYRSGPTSAGKAVAGKYLAYLTAAAATGTALVVGVVAGLDVPLLGFPGYVALVVALVAASSIGLGLMVSLVSRSDSQAVQISMIILLASLFFSGFFLTVDRLDYPYRALSWLLPVTYGIRSLHEVMLQGRTVSVLDLLGLAALTVVGLLGAIGLLRRQLKVS